MIAYREGDAARPDGPAIIARVVNDIGKWGAGFTEALGQRYPLAERSYRSWHARELGRVRIAPVAHGVAVAHLCAQRGVGTDRRRVDYSALDVCLGKLSGWLWTTSAPHTRAVWMPRIGCVLAGGRWDRIEPIVIRHLSAFNVTICVPR